MFGREVERGRILRLRRRTTAKRRRKDALAKEATAIDLLRPAEIPEAGSVLDEIARDGAGRMLRAAVNAEVDAWVEQFAGQGNAESHRQVVRNGDLPERAVLTEAGPLSVMTPCIRDKSGEQKLTSQILQPFLRRVPGVTGRGAIARNSVGIVIVGGMTINTLSVVPSVYVLIAQDHSKKCETGGKSKARAKSKAQARANESSTPEIWKLSSLRGGAPRPRTSQGSGWTRRKASIVGS